MLVHANMNIVIINVQQSRSTQVPPPEVGVFTAGKSKSYAKDDRARQSDRYIEQSDVDIYLPQLTYMKYAYRDGTAVVI